MVGAPFDGGWETVADAAYYPGLGSGEAIWLYISIAMCVIALIVGHIHEGKAYRKADRDHNH
ncbi:MAG: hypothetical protein KTR35_04640 [Gammaproteobacteria bacterium]|nr:hypothetical protein [Gammaproteobacteria bacterium]